MGNKKALSVKIVVPALIVAAIVIVWLVKNNPGDFEALAEYGIPVIIDCGSDSCTGVFQCGRHSICTK